MLLLGFNSTLILLNSNHCLEAVIMKDVIKFVFGIVSNNLSMIVNEVNDLLHQFIWYTVDLCNRLDQSIYAWSDGTWMFIIILELGSILDVDSGPWFVPLRRV